DESSGCGGGSFFIRWTNPCLASSASSPGQAGHPLTCSSTVSCSASGSSPLMNCTSRSDDGQALMLLPPVTPALPAGGGKVLELHPPEELHAEGKSPVEGKGIPANCKRNPEEVCSASGQLLLLLPGADQRRLGPIQAASGDPGRR